MNFEIVGEITVVETIAVGTEIRDQASAKELREGPMAKDEGHGACSTGERKPQNG